MDTWIELSWTQWTFIGMAVLSALVMWYSVRTAKEDPDDARMREEAQNREREHDSYMELMRSPKTAQLMQRGSILFAPWSSTEQSIKNERHRRRYELSQAQHAIEFADWLANNFFVPSEDGCWKIDKEHISFSGWPLGQDNDTYETEYLYQKYMQGYGDI